MVKVGAKPGEVVEIEWCDSFSSTGWATKAEVMDMATSKDVICKTVGYLFHHNKDYITVLQSVALHNGDGENTMTIPRGLIKKLKKIGKGIRKT